MTGTVECGYVYVDGSTVGDISDSLIKDRRILRDEGLDAVETTPDGLWTSQTTRSSAPATRRPSTDDPRAAIGPNTDPSPTSFQSTRSGSFPHR